jgi:hypothetical protein
MGGVGAEKNQEYYDRCGGHFHGSETEHTRRRFGSIGEISEMRQRASRVLHHCGSVVVGSWVVSVSDCGDLLVPPSFFKKLSAALRKISPPTAQSV